MKKITYVSSEILISIRLAYIALAITMFISGAFFIFPFIEPEFKELSAIIITILYYLIGISLFIIAVRIKV